MGIAMILNRNFADLLRCFESNSVRFMILGGYAVNFYGVPRSTKDIDLWVAVDPTNADLVSKSLVQFGFGASAVPAELFRQEKRVLAFGREPWRVDILTGPDGVDFEDCYQRRVVTEIDGLRVPFVALADLIRNKQATGRLRDLADVEELQKLTK